jgi:hypothetical protein
LNCKRPELSLKIGLVAAMVFAVDGCAVRRHSLAPSINEDVQQTEIYVLPANHPASVVVVYADSDGVTGVIRNGIASDADVRVEREYRIPDSGFLRIRDDHPPEAARASIRLGAEGKEARIWGECSSFQTKIRTAASVPTGCWLPQIAPSNLHPIPFYVAAVIADSVQFPTTYMRAIQLVADSVFRGRVDIPSAWRKPPP